MVNWVVSSPGNEITSEQVANQLFNNAQSKAPDKMSEEAEPNKPVESKPSKNKY